VANTSSDLALRTEPSISADVVKTVPPGSVLGVLLLDEEWAYVYDGLNTGWTFVGTLDLTPPTPDLTNLASATGIVTTDSAVALRAEPDLAGEVVATVEDGAEVEVLAYDDTGLFALVLYEEEGITGWAFTQNFSIEDIGVGVGSLADVAGGISFRDAPDGDRFFYLYYPGDVVILGRSEDGEWLKIRYPDLLTISGEEVVGQEGWVAASLIDTGADIDSLPVVEETE
jgi:SH3-like domain-containing protein